MKNLSWGLMVTCLLTVAACQENEKIQSDFTGNEVTYPLLPGSSYAIDGTVTLKERKDGTTTIIVAISGTEGNVEHPVHLHLGNISTPDADIYAQLNPVVGRTGTSETILKFKADETVVTYDELRSLYASVKIHLSASGPEKDIVLAGGNIGTASLDDTATGRYGIGVCKSE